MNELLSMGMTKAEIARAVGRDSAVMTQIERGAKPYRNLEPSLRALRDQRQGKPVTIPEAPRRMTKSGQQAKVRQKTNYADRRVVRVKQQAVRSGARSIRNRLRQAAADGSKVAFTVVYPTSVPIGKSGHREPPASETEHTIELGFGGAHQGEGHAQDMLDRVEAEGGDVGAALSAYIAQNDLGDTEGVTPLAIELRVWG
ncbi:hypothetical protein [Streptomyces collinus]|uniref:hypothetical protein n=1 Tax=Streptomyces collinus TaxID=42684 RepID=UPI0011DDB10E|nr:hypothetical protein [Streptomyces collinus]